MSRYASYTPEQVDKIVKAFTPFKIMAFVVGCGLLLLVLEMVLTYGFDNPVLKWWAIPHGFLFMIYAACTANLGLVARWEPLKMVGVILAGCVPFLSFWVERKVSGEVAADLAAVGR